jgi:tyrosyl-tRNA synthetase
VKVRFAREIVERFHGPAAAREAQDAFEQRYRHKEAPTNLAETRVPITAESIRLDQLLRNLGECKSGAEAKRVILGGGVRIDDEKVSDADLVLRKGQRFILRVGKNPYRLIVLH